MWLLLIFATEFLLASVYGLIGANVKNWTLLIVAVMYFIVAFLSMLVKLHLIIVSWNERSLVITHGIQVISFGCLIIELCQYSALNGGWTFIIMIDLALKMYIQKIHPGNLFFNHEQKLKLIIL